MQHFEPALVAGWTQAREVSAGVRIINGVPAAPAFRGQFPSGASALFDLMNDHVSHRAHDQGHGVPFRR